MATEIARIGRPPLTPGRPKRSAFNTRIRAELKDRLTGRAVECGRSLSEEIERRLELSFDDDEARQVRRENFTYGYWSCRDDDEIKEMCARFEAKVWADCGGYYARLSDDGWWLHSWFGGMSVYPPDGAARTWLVNDGD